MGLKSSLSLKNAEPVSFPFPRLKCFPLSNIGLLFSSPLIDLERIWLADVSRVSMLVPISQQQLLSFPMSHSVDRFEIKINHSFGNNSLVGFRNFIKALSSCQQGIHTHHGSRISGFQLWHEMLHKHYFVVC